MGLTIAKGYLLARTPYRIFDEIITILTSNGARIALLALGTRKLQSKNARNLFFGHLLEFSFFAARTSKKVSKLKSVHTLVAVP
jgi:recombinational DNA repair protein (RecF pathway)